MWIKERIAGMSERQKFWAAVVLSPFVPLLTLALIPVLLIFMIATVLYTGAEDLIDCLWRWASGKPQRRTDYWGP